MKCVLREGIHAAIEASRRVNVTAGVAVKPELCRSNVELIIMEGGNNEING